MKFGGLHFAGLDIETTGSDVREAGLIQIGIDLGDGLTFVSDVRPHGDAVITDEAMRVNGFTHSRMEAAPYSHQVDCLLRDWLESQGIGNKRLVAIGWNVGGFDLPFVNKFLPLTARHISYRSVDLNAVVFTLDPVDGQEKVKAQLKRIAQENLRINGRGGEWHDALYDASAVLVAWRALGVALEKTPWQMVLDAIEESK